MQGVKEFIESFKTPVDWEKKLKTKSKERGMTVDELRREWEDARIKGLTKGVSLHHRKRQEYADADNYIYYAYKKHEEGEEYTEQDYTVKEGFVYDEKPFIVKKFGLIGIPDRITVVDRYVNIDDFKSDKEIYKESYRITNGKFSMKKKLQPPISHLDECNYLLYNLQLSLYMRMVLYHNKSLRPGVLRILHTKHNEETLEPGKETIYEVPYLRREVEALLNTLK